MKKIKSQTAVGKILNPKTEEVVDITPQKPTADQTFVNWLMRYGLWTFTAVVAASAGIIFAMNWRSSSHAEQEMAYAGASKDVSDFIQKESIENADIQKMANLTKQSPSFEARFAGILAQAALLAGKPEQANSFFSLPSPKVEAKEAELYKAYTDVSIELAAGKTDTALAATRKLAEALSMPSQPATLRIYNLFRLASLEETCGDAARAKAALSTLKSFATDGKSTFLSSNQEAYLKLSDALGGETLNLASYLDWKIAQL